MIFIRSPPLSIVQILALLLLYLLLPLLLLFVYSHFQILELLANIILYIGVISSPFTWAPITSHIQYPSPTFPSDPFHTFVRFSIFFAYGLFISDKSIANTVSFPIRLFPSSISFYSFLLSYLSFPYALIIYFQLLLILFLRLNLDIFDSFISRDACIPYITCDTNFFSGFNNPSVIFLLNISICSFILLLILLSFPMGFFSLFWGNSFPF